MYKLNPLAAIIVGTLALTPSLTFAAPAAAAATTTTTTATTTKHYKSERPNYKGEIRKPVYKEPVRRPVMQTIFLQEGPYVGISAGYDSYKVDENVSFSNTSTGGHLIAGINPTINTTGMIGALLAGYGHYFNNALYLGGEVFLNESAAYQSNNYTVADAVNNISYNGKFYASTGYGVNLLPGVKLSDSALVFFRIGYQIARLRGQENSYINGTASLVSNTSSWDGGFNYGLGFEEAMVENFSLRGDYVHTDYRAFTATSGTQYAPSNNQFLLSLVYHIT